MAQTTWLAEVRRKISPRHSDDNPTWVLLMCIYIYSTHTHIYIYMYIYICIYIYTWYIYIHTHVSTRTCVFQLWFSNCQQLFFRCASIARASTPSAKRAPRRGRSSSATRPLRCSWIWRKARPTKTPCFGATYGRCSNMGMGQNPGT